MVTTSDLQRIAEKQRKTENRRESGLPRRIDVSPQILDSHALVITGVRRCGKSTLMTQRIRKSGDTWFYLKFDAPQLVNLELADSERLDAVIEGFAAKRLYFDEVHELDGWESFVLEKLDDNLTHGNKFDVRFFRVVVHNEFFADNIPAGKRVEPYH